LIRDGIVHVLQRAVLCWRSVDVVAFCGLLFTAQPKAPAFALAGAFGWAVNDYFNSLLLGSHQRL
jgi:hypothetical protein